LFEIFGQKDIEEVIEVNKLICSYHNEPVGVDMEILNSIFDKVNSYNEISDRRARIIKKATHILAGISYNQPFIEGNRRTSHYLVKNFLGRYLTEQEYEFAKEFHPFMVKESLEVVRATSGRPYDEKLYKKQLKQMKKQNKEWEKQQKKNKK